MNVAFFATFPTIYANNNLISSSFTGGEASGVYQHHTHTRKVQ